MKFTIGKPVGVKAEPNTFQIQIEVMFGDGDGYQKLIVKSFRKDEDEAALIDLIETLGRMDAAYPQGRRGGDNYRDVEGFMSWFSDYPGSESEYLSERCKVPYADFLKHSELAQPIISRMDDELYWPYDPTSEEDDAGYVGYKVFYYDQELVQHKVKVS